MSSLADLAWLGHPGPGCLACFTPGDAVSSQTGVPTQPGDTALTRSGLPTWESR